MAEILPYRQAIPLEYSVQGLVITNYCKVNSRAEAVDFETPNGSEFSLAKDALGIQFCMEGRMWPNSTSWASMEKAITYIREHTAEAIAFFDSDDPGEKMFDIVDVAFAATARTMDSLS